MIRVVLDSSVLISAFLTPQGVPGQVLDALDLAALAELAIELPKLRVVPDDPKDDMIVATAVKAKADYLVSGDRHLLSLGEHDGIRMITPRELLAVIGPATASETPHGGGLTSNLRINAISFIMTRYAGDQCTAIALGGGEDFGEGRRRPSRRV